jgi:hypothetical protein
LPIFSPQPDMQTMIALHDTTMRPLHLSEK